MGKNLSVDSFEVDGELILCELIDADDSDAGKSTISMEAFAKWLDANEYLEGSDEVCTGCDHTGEPTYVPSNWNYTLDEILKGESQWSIYELLNKFINKMIENISTKTFIAASAIILKVPSLMVGIYSATASRIYTVDNCTKKQAARRAYGTLAILQSFKKNN